MIEFLHHIKSDTVNAENTKQFLHSLDDFLDTAITNVDGKTYYILQNLVDEVSMLSMWQNTPKVYVEFVEEPCDVPETLRRIEALICDFLYLCHSDLMAIDHMRYSVGDMFNGKHLGKYAFVGDSIVETDIEGERVQAYQSVWLKDNGQNLVIGVSTLNDDPEFKAFQFVAKKNIEPPKNSFTVCS